MRYKKSHVDKDNLRWFLNDFTVATLKSIELKRGRLRGITAPFKLDFSYPISAIAGENGSGKSTVLAMATCGFHNPRKGYKPPGRKLSYYTFSDFFIQSQREIPPNGITIRYGFWHDNWRGLKPGLGYQLRRKNIGGRWNNYAGRVKRNVIYHGIQRVVPHYERSASRSYSGVFSLDKIDEDTLTRIKEIAGRIIGKNYNSFNIHSHSKYRLPSVEVNGDYYSGFNMGAGESAVFEILLTLFEAGRGTLLVIDEIELGLHEKSQKKFIDELKKLCKELHCQIICSTHSPVILDSLPPEARFYIESKADKTIVIPGISSKYACGKLSGTNSNELSVFVEDTVAESVINDFLTADLRKRITIHHVGSSEAVLRHLASKYKEGVDTCISVLDGDKKAEHSISLGKVKNYLETTYRVSEDEANDWIENRLKYLPGDSWPEISLIDKVISLLESDNDQLADCWGINSTDLRPQLEAAKRAGKHNEFFALADGLGLTIEQVRTDVNRFIKSNSNYFQELKDDIKLQLDEVPCKQDYDFTF